MSASGDEAGASALQQFCLLAKSVKGNACESLISQALEHPSIFVFAELLDVPSVQALADTPSAPSLELLKLFAYGTWADYKARAASFPTLSDAQRKKLKKLSVVTLSAQNKRIPYDKLLRELEFGSVRQIEDLLIECFYEGLIQGKLDQQAAQLDVHYCIGRDIHPSEVNAMCEILDHWHQNSIELLSSMREKLDNYKQLCESQRTQQAELESKVDAAKLAVRTSQDNSDIGGGSGDFDASFDEDVEKMRKGGRSKAKHSLAVGPRK